MTALEEGLAAYRRGEYEAARRSWSGQPAKSEAPEAILLRSLSAIAEAAGSGAPMPELLELDLLPRKLLGLDVADLRRQLESGVTIPTLTPDKQLSRGAVGRFALLVLLAAAGFVALRWTPLAELATRDRMIALLGDVRGAWWSPLALIGLYLVLSPLGVPATPLMAAGGIVFGLVLGSLINFVGLMLGAASSYWVARTLGQELVEHFVGGILQRVERRVERHGFWTLVRLRFVPVPFAVFNFACALGRIRFPLFLSSTALGLAPIVVIWTYFWAAILQAAAGPSGDVYRNMFLAIAAVFLLTFLPRAVRGVWRRRKLRALRKRRTRRRKSGSGPSPPKGG